MKTIEYLPEKIKFLPNLQRVEPFSQDSTIQRELFNCRRRYFYRFVLGRVPKGGDKYQICLDFGAAGHRFMELLELKGYSEAMTYILQVNLPKVDPTFKFAYLDNIRLVKTCQILYEAWKIEKAEKKIEVIAVEQPFNCAVTDKNGDEFVMGGRADQIIKWNGRLWGRDFKFTSKDEQTFTKGLDPNDQTIRYIHGESQVHGQEIQGIVFYAIQNSKTVGPKIFQKLSTRNKYQIDTWLEEQKLNNELLNKFYRERDIWPMDTHNCGWCPYHKVCTSKSPQSMEAILKNDYMLKAWDHTSVIQEGE